MTQHTDDSYFARARQRRDRARAGRDEGRAGTNREGNTRMPDMDAIARGYGAERGGFFGSRSYYTGGAETDRAFRNRAEAVSPYFGDNLGTAIEPPAPRGTGERVGRTPPYGIGSQPAAGAVGGTSARPEPATHHTRWHREPLMAHDIMTSSVKTVHEDAPIDQAAKIMRDENTGVVPVVGDDDTLRGIVTDRDIVMRSVADGKDPRQLSAADLMTRDVDVATPDEAVVDVIHLMGDKQIRRVPVVDERDRLVGIISIADIATRADYDTDLQDALEEISLRRSFWKGLV